MKFLNGQMPINDLTYNDVFLVPGFSKLNSRFDTDLSPADHIGTSIPIVVANMNAVAGKRMAETVARRGGIVVLPQDIPLPNLESIVKYVKTRHSVYETPLSLKPENTIADALNIIYKRAHEATVIVNDANEPVGIFKAKDAAGFDTFTSLQEVMTRDVLVIPEGLAPREMFDFLHQNRLTIAPVVGKDKKMVGIMTQKGAVRSDIYQPAVDGNDKLLVAAALGINGDVEGRASKLMAMGVDIVVLDTAHGYQEKMIQAIKTVHKAYPKLKIVAGNVVTAEATRALIEAGASIVKVGVGPGAMCTTRVMTAYGRPQFSAVLECAAMASKMGAHVWADGGIRYPRDVVLALAAGASSVMWGSMFAGTYESVGDVLRDSSGQLYKENYGMASRRAVKNRNAASSAFEVAKKEFFEEGISTSKQYINPVRPSAEDIIDYVTAGLRSAMSYSGADTLQDFHEVATVGLQSASGYQEGFALAESWD
jgi:IMP dehydrogenase